MRVEVAYACGQQQKLIALEVPPTTTVLRAVQQSNIAQLFPEIDPENIDKGIFAQKTSNDTILQPNDRVELYRPLTIDPKQKRRVRAKKTKAWSGVAPDPLIWYNKTQ